MSPTSNTGPDAGPAPTARGDVPPAAAAASMRELCALRSSAEGADSDDEDADGASVREWPSAVASPLACDDAGDSGGLSDRGGGSDEDAGDCGPTSGLMWALADP
jgi:hypothetical protein